MIISRSIHVAANGIILFFYGEVVFHPVYTPHCLSCKPSTVSKRSGEMLQFECAKCKNNQPEVQLISVDGY